ncbi:MAG: ATP-dependent DNA helicase RecG [Marinilabiliales bacterium]
MTGLNNDINYLKGVGPKRAELLSKELKIKTFNDLLFYFPYKYIDRTKFYKIAELSADLPYIQVRGKITGFELVGAGKNQRLVAFFKDETGVIEIVWFKGIKWMRSSLKPETEYIVFGKPSLFGSKINIIHPEIDLAKDFDNKPASALQAQYSITEKLKNNYITSKTILKLQETLISNYSKNINESLPDYIIKKFGLISLKEALINIHFPRDTKILAQAEYRLKFEELFYIQLKLLYNKELHQKNISGLKFSVVGKFFNDFYFNNLPFELTGAQKRVIKEIRRDLGSGRQMNRLLQGDVGSGKTLVALMSMLIALDNGYQACLMAPSEILAIQHFKSITKLLEGLDINVKLLTGSSKKSERDILHEELEKGDLQILIGTHALIEDTVQFNKLGLVIIDEQHRFGVAQRAKLWEKNLNPPHVLVMTATPIPRTLALTLYGDLDVSVIDEMPPGRKPIITGHYTDAQRLKMFAFLEKQIAKGRQIYIVYPLIKESEKLDYKDLEDGLESISRRFPPPKYAISVVHGKMKPADKEKSMELFVKGKTHIMIATTVIEVGVDVPNASVMVIESAERFGLSQLHQLRGRVGRGAEQSYCILMTKEKLSNEAKIRMNTMTRTNDGFEISEVDMKLRGPGDMDGTQQSGMAFDLKIAKLAQDGRILEQARSAAKEIIESDPALENDENAILKNTLRNMISKTKIWRNIS